MSGRFSRTKTGCERDLIFGAEAFETSPGANFGMIEGVATIGNSRQQFEMCSVRELEGDVIRTPKLNLDPFLPQQPDFDHLR